jgi:hypothetical protein
VLRRNEPRSIRHDAALRQAPAFKQALEQRLKDSSASGADFARRRQLLVFDRFLARISHLAGDAAILKGGLVLELRLARARTTKDVDLRMTGSPDDLPDRLQAAGRLDLGDYMRFEIQADPRHPDLRDLPMQHRGYRFRAECRLAGKLYGRRFGVDVGFGDPIVGEPDLVVGHDLLGFAGIEPPAVRVYPVVSHVAEKLHALTMPRPRPNTRVRDLPDLALLATLADGDVGDGVVASQHVGLPGGFDGVVDGPSILWSVEEWRNRQTRRETPGGLRKAGATDRRAASLPFPSGS